MENIKSIYFEDLAYVQSKVSNDVLEELKNEAKFILENQSQFKKFDPTGVGNLDKQYLTNKSKEILEKDLITLANEYHKHSQETQHCLNWEILPLWFNFQKKYEYIPVHNHNGCLSFVLWITIPYDLEEELSPPNCKNEVKPPNSLFEFNYINFLGKMKGVYINVDKTYEGTIVMFPSELHHTVYPFYRSDEYRISLAGNLAVGPSKNTFSYQ